MRSAIQRIVARQGKITGLEYTIRQEEAALETTDNLISDGLADETRQADEAPSRSVPEAPGHSVPEAVGIKRFGIAALEDLLYQLRQPAFRSQQLIEWLYGRAARSYTEMSNLPATLRQALAAEQPLSTPEIKERLVSKDGSRKYLLELADGAAVECVGIPDGQRLTVCFSTQVGCAMGCVFCATGQLGLIRQLAAGEMVDQLNLVGQDFGQRVTNAVAMGEGEPFANYAATLDALRLINHAKGLAIGARHITVSTCGLPSGIRAFAKEPEQFRLAISLHSAQQETRDMLMPGLRHHRLRNLQQAIFDYGDKTGRRTSLEYVLINGINDTDDEIVALMQFCEGLDCHVNLIGLNPPGGGRGGRRDGAGGESADGERAGGGSAGGERAGGGSAGGIQLDLTPDSPIRTLVDLTPSSPGRARFICQELQAVGIEASLRRSRGADILGACGQLAGQA